MKLVNTKDDLRNQYGRYDNNTIIGNYSQNKITLDPQDIEDITPVPGDFRVMYSIDGQLFGSSTYISEIRNSNNPYITKSTLPIIEFNSSDLINATDFTIREQYAENEMLSSLETIDDLKLHIAWLLDKSQQSLRKVGVDYGKFATEESVTFTPYNPNTDTGLGFELSEKVQRPIE